MKQRSPDHFSAITTYVQLITKCETVPRNIQYMVVNRHVTVLNVLLCPAEIIGFQNIGRGFAYLSVSPAKLLQTLLPALRLSVRAPCCLFLHFPAPLA